MGQRKALEPRDRAINRTTINGVACLSFVAILSLSGCGTPIGVEFLDVLAGLLGASAEQTSCGGGVEFAIPDCPLGLVCFSRACDRHDTCYILCDRPKTICDIEFFEDMLVICTEEFSEEELQFWQCRDWAFVFWLAVDRFAQTQYDFHCAFFEDVGACCDPTPPGRCLSDTTRGQCRDLDGAFFDGLDCPTVDELLGGCALPDNDECANARPVCVSEVPMDEPGVCAFDDEADQPFAVCDVAEGDCPFGVSCQPVDTELHRCTVDTSNVLATTDGPTERLDCGESVDETFQADVWYHFTAPCSGTLTVHMCDQPEYDAMLAVYGTHAPDDGCLCPAENEALLICNDDFCGPGTTSGVTIEHAVGGACYTIRIGGWSSDGSVFATSKGDGRLDIGMICDTSPTP